MSERTDPTIKQIIDAINTQRDVSMIDNFIKKKLEKLEMCFGDAVPTREICAELGINYNAQCGRILAIVECYFEILERELEDLKNGNLLTHALLENQTTNPVPNNPEHA